MLSESPPAKCYFVEFFRYSRNVGDEFRRYRWNSLSGHARGLKSSPEISDSEDAWNGAPVEFTRVFVRDCYLKIFVNFRSWSSSIAERNRDSASEYVRNRSRVRRKTNRTRRCTLRERIVGGIEKLLNLPAISIQREEIRETIPNA